MEEKQPDEWARDLYKRLKDVGMTDEQIEVALGGLKGKKRAYIAPDIFLRVLCGGKDRQDVVDLLKRDDVEFVSDLFALYEALMCIGPQDEFDRTALIAIFKKVHFSANEELRPLYVPLREERVHRLREAAGLKNERGVKHGIEKETEEAEAEGGSGEEGHDVPH